MKRDGNGRQLEEEARKGRKRSEAKHGSRRRERASKNVTRGVQWCQPPPTDEKASESAEPLQEWELVLLIVGLGILYFVLLVVLGVRTFQNKHYFLFAFGFVIPVIWIVGAMLPPKGMSHVDELYARRGETD